MDYPEWFQKAWLERPWEGLKRQLNGRTHTTAH